MPRLRFMIHAAAVLIVSLACASLAQADAQRVYLAFNGTDSGACARTAPCKTFPYAFTQVLPKGEVVVLNTLSHPPITINKSVTIVAAPGAYVVISSKVAGGTAVSITVGFSAVVVLRGLTVTGQGVGANGIRFNGTGTLHVEDCVVSGFTEHGIFQSDQGAMFIKDTNVRDGQGYGIRINDNDSSGNIRASIDHCRIENISPDVGAGVAVGNNARVLISNTVSLVNDGVGFVVAGSGRMTVSDSTAEGNTHGFVASDGGLMTVTRSTAGSNSDVGFFATISGAMNIDSSVTTANGHGIIAGSSGSVVRVARTMVVNNQIHGLFKTSGGTLISRGNNTVMGNTTETQGTITYVTGPQ